MAVEPERQEPVVPSNDPTAVVVAPAKETTATEVEPVVETEVVEEPVEEVAAEPEEKEYTQEELIADLKKQGIDLSDKPAPKEQVAAQQRELSEDDLLAMQMPQAFAEQLDGLTQSQLFERIIKTIPAHPSVVKLKKDNERLQAALYEVHAKEALREVVAGDPRARAIAGEIQKELTAKPWLTPEDAKFICLGRMAQPVVAPTKKSAATQQPTKPIVSAKPSTGGGNFKAPPKSDEEMSEEAFNKRFG